MDLNAFLILAAVLFCIGVYGVLARRNGVRVEAFSIGFGPELFGRTDKNGTRWKFCAVPLGGYVKMFGEGETTAAKDGARELTAAEKAVSFHHKRAAIVFAGPFVNYVFAVIVFAALFATAGQPFTPSVIGAVVPGGPGVVQPERPGNYDIEMWRYSKELKVISDNPVLGHEHRRSASAVGSS